jgi:hypothetical protein
MTMTFTFRIEPALVRVLKDIKSRDGIPVSEQIRQALEMWFLSKGAQKVAQRSSFDDADVRDVDSSQLGLQAPPPAG